MYINSSGLETTLAESWNGTKWTLQVPASPPDTNSTLLGVACSSLTQCEAVGTYQEGSSGEVALADGWNGTTWSLQTASAPSGAASSSLDSVACFSSSDCEAVGDYQNASDLETTLTEGWNGTTWSLQTASAPSGAASSSLDSVACSSSTSCEALGYYYPSGSTAASIFAEGWNGTTWSLQTTPAHAGATSSAWHGVSCSSATDCEAVGDYDTGGFGSGEPFAERWNGSKWALQTVAAAADATNLLSGVSCSSTDCEAVGQSYFSTSGSSHNLAERWNGDKWALQPIPTLSGGTLGYLDGVSCSSATHCETVGYYANGSGDDVPSAESWNGSRWALQTTPTPSGMTDSYLLGVSCSSSSDCEAVGFSNASGDDATLTEGWNGTKWTLQTTPNPNGSTLEGVSCSSTSDCEAVGASYNSSGVLVTLAESWNGTSWTVQTVPNPAGATRSYLDAVVCSSSSDCDAVGAYFNSSGVLVTLAESWNGTSWTAQSVPNPTGATSSSLDGVACSSSSDCEAVGASYNSSGVLVTLAEGWNGTEWVLQATPTPTGATYSSFDGVACSSTSDCEAVGASYNSSGVPMTLAEGWNGTTWTLQSTQNPNDATYSLLKSVSCPSSSACEAVGYNGIREVQRTLVEAWSS